MIKRTLEISDGPTFLNIENDQLLLSRHKEQIARIPCEDVGLLIVDNVATTYTHSVFTRLLQCGAVVLLCGPNHLPAAMLLSMDDNQLTARRMRIQAAAPRPLRKRLWKQIVRRKVKLQAMNLPSDHPMRGLLLEMSAQVKSGDSTNIEGQAARFYWPALLGDDFRRDPDGPSPNNLLNYGYTVMRAAVARALVAAGLHPVFSLQHIHRNNPFALADDLVEPLRPLVDRAVLHLLAQQIHDLDRPAKKILLELLSREIIVADQSGPLMVQLHRVASSLLHCYQKKRKTLLLPDYSLNS